MQQIFFAFPRAVSLTLVASAALLSSACDTTAPNPVAPSSSLDAPAPAALSESDALRTAQAKPMAVPFDTILVNGWSGDCIVTRGKQGLRFKAVGEGPDVGQTVFPEIRISGGLSIGQPGSVKNNGAFRTRWETEGRVQFSTGTAATCVLRRLNEDLATVDVTLP